jgi:hypothetical protein
MLNPPDELGPPLLLRIPGGWAETDGNNAHIATRTVNNATIE